jgi:hypothetical protein
MDIKRFHGKTSRPLFATVAAVSSGLKTARNSGGIRRNRQSKKILLYQRRRVAVLGGCCERVSPH